MKIQFKPIALALAVAAVSYPLPTALAGTAVTSVAAGQGHAIFSKADGSLWAIAQISSGNWGLASCRRTRMFQ